MRAFMGVYDLCRRNEINRRQRRPRSAANYNKN